MALNRPLGLLDTYFYTDFTGHKSVEMLKTDKTEGTEDENQQKLCISDGTAHDLKHPFIQEFSELLSRVPLNTLLYTLMTYQQRLLAKAIWESENYGGSESKCIESLKDIYGYRWQQVTKLSDHMKPFRDYCEYVLILDHQQQWNKQKNPLHCEK